MSEMTLERLEQMRGATVYDSTGEKIGAVEEIYYDESTNQPEWLGIGTGFFGTKRVLVPVQGSRSDADEVTIGYSADQVKDSPDIDSDEISVETERELYAYYGLEWSENRSDTGLPDGTSGSGAELERDADQQLTRSEEELRVGKEQVETGRARLRKWVETEPVEAQVELRRETAEITREPINQPVSDVELGEQEIEVPLHEERPVVQKQTVAKERVGIETEVTAETETVRDEVRKERIDVEEGR
jgi:uncharacterized protein (TIGR02271 family)